MRVASGLGGRLLIVIYCPGSVDVAGSPGRARGRARSGGAFPPLVSEQCSIWYQCDIDTSVISIRVLVLVSLLVLVLYSMFAG